MTLEPTGVEFPVKAHEDILSAALRHGINLQYGCRHGKCSSCKHWLVDGDVDDSAASVYAIPRDERQDGAILLCCTRAKSDLVIEIDNYDDLEQLPELEPPSTRSAVVLSRRSLNPKLDELRVQLDHPLSFRAGQYAEFTVNAAGERRSYSMLSPPSLAGELTFCITRIDGGLFSGRLDELTAGTELELEAPFGTMFLRDTNRPVIAAAVGSGISPILSMLAEAAERAVAVPIRFYYGAATADDLVYLDTIEELARRLPDFTFIPCLTRGDTDGVPRARPGRVTLVIAADIADASGYDAYLCGMPQMCDTVGQLLELKGLPNNRIHADKFYSAVDSISVTA
ncbi:2Fe-2S iron-sulfur cluster-binding protein [Mycobacterium sp. TY815]|uniref:2Fe-2S iron-sulfur cluster-binding protein n=1 Tax=Mycobacterium sp. TY815 TaxID=3050581 RepID=UPI0026A1F842|nr:2Fe-2S iron-sulfur cluster-binding protein [Mycobacterium sp. TY815]MDP7704825.1 2Fe-2S iron-sulfur cluster-binding protein [Mycobacterium sp. TY815]